MSVIVSRILHAGYIFENSGARIAFDPIFENPFSRNCYAFPAIEFNLEDVKRLQLDAIFISHFHDDHCSLESLDHLDRKIPIYIFCLSDEIPELIRKIGFKTVHLLKTQQIVDIKTFKITVHRALDVDVDSVFQIQVAGKNILNVVDSWIDWETIELLKKNGPWDLILWPFQTMRELEVLSPNRSGFSPPELPIEWLEQLQLLEPLFIVPSSCQFVQEPWSWYNQAFFPITYRFFEEQINKILPTCEVVRLNPGKSIELNDYGLQRAPDLSWIKPIGDQNVDYDYDSNLIVPSTRELARKFSKLLAHQVQVVNDFLTIKIIQHYELLNTTAEEYFAQTRIWKLRTYNFFGDEKTYLYELDQKKLKLLTDATKLTEPIGWLTEIAEAKIYSALTDGESLTSLYIRINDETFAEQIEEQLVSTDATMDPLVRCLFSLNLDSYQQAQYLRLQRKNQN